MKPIKIVALLSLSFLFSFSSCIMGKRAEEQSEDAIENDSVNTNKIKDSIQKDSLNDNVDTFKK